MTSIIGSFSFPMEKKVVMDEFEKVAKREGGKSKVIIELIEQWTKIHGEGNPAFTIEQFMQPDFKAVPAYLTDIDKWVEHYRNSDEKEKTQLRIRAIELQKKFRMVDINE